MTYIRRKTERWRFWLVLGCALALLGWHAGVWARVLIPTSAQEILGALGPDANGLDISQDNLPDLFTLTASRIEENPKSFIYQQTYDAGRWKGGKVVIEYARDLSYTIVSVYDKSGKRQRIYSVTSKAAEQEPTRSPTESESPSRVQEVPAAVEPTPLPQDHVQAPTPAPREETKPLPQVPPEAASPPVRTPKTNRRTASSEEMPPVARSYRPPSAAVAKHDTTKIVDTKIDVSAAPAAFEWDEDKGAYVPIKSEGTPAKTESAATPRHRHHRGHRKVAEEETQIARTPSRVPARPSVASSEQPTSQAASGYEWDESKGAYVPISGTGASAASAAPEEPAAKPSRKSRRAAPPASESAIPVVASLPKPMPPATVTELHPSPVSGTGSSKLTAEEVPSTEELLGGAAEKSSQVSVSQPPAPLAEKPEEKPSRRQGHKRSETPVAPPAKPEPPIPAVSKLPPAPVAAEDQALAAAKKKYEKAEPAGPPTTEELLAAGAKSKGPDTAESDHWVPKAVPKSKVVEPEIPIRAAESPKVAMVPKPVDNSVNALLKIAAEGKGEMPHESDAWVPKKAAASNPDADIEAELARVRKMKAPAAPPRAVKVKHDINNPEEGVLPVSQFEKFSGPRYGRHREYERRFFVGKRTKSPVANYDFYVDEVDRKKEIHNVYYYKRDKQLPKLVAVERHDRVTFLSNYDVDTEDKGKVVTY